MKNTGLLARMFGCQDDQPEDDDEVGSPPSLEGVEFHRFDFFIGIDWQRVGPADPVRWRLVFYSHMGGTHSAFDMVSSYVAGPDNVNCTQWDIPIDAICLPAHSDRPLHEDMEAKEMAFHDGVLFVRCGGDADHYHVVDIMKKTFKPDIFYIVTLDIISINLRQLAWEGNPASQEELVEAAV
ncbi:MAG: hypothetical protein WCO09_03380 [bacterium]